jgi:hypothetical protein
VARDTRKQDVPLPPPARNHAVRGIAGLIAPVLRPAFRKRAPAAANLLADWGMLAGPDLAARAAPVKFAGGTLTLACTGPVAMELQYTAPAMIERLRFVQQAPVNAPAPVPLQRQNKPERPKNLPDGELGEALAQLYQGIAMKG